MRRVLATEHGQALYRQRQHLIESLFGNTKHNRGLRQSHRKGRAAVRTEWRLITATHNRLKLHKHQTQRKRTTPACALSFCASSAPAATSCPRRPDPRGTFAALMALKLESGSRWD